MISNLLTKSGLPCGLLIGLLSGAANGLFGAGGGLVAVMLLSKILDTKAAHVTSLALTLPLSVVSCIVYAINSNIDFKTALLLIPAGIAGAIVGTRLMLKISVKILKKLFAVILIICAVRLIL